VPVNSARAPLRSPRRVLVAIGLAATLLIPSAVTATAAGPAASVEDGLQPTIHWEQARAHEHDRITFTAGGRVTVGFKPRTTDRWSVGGVSSRPLPAGRIDGRAMRAQGRTADPSVDRPIVDAREVVDARATVAAAPAADKRATRELQAPVDPGALRREVFGFLPYWQVNSSSLRIRYDKISTIAYFGVGADTAGNLQKRNSDGSVTTGWSGWTSARLTAIIDAAHATGTRVVLTVQSFAWNTSGAARQRSLLGSWTARDNLARQIAAAVRDRGADGVNLDFEPLVSGMDGQFVALIKQIRQRLDAVHRGYQITFDTTGHIGNYPIERATTSGADAIFIMGYDYRGASSSPVGSVAPLSRVGYDIRDTVAAYAARVPRSKLILGVPYYGRAWSTDSNLVHARNISGTKYGASTAVTYLNAVPFFTDHGKHYETTEQVAWTVYRRRNCTSTYGCVNPYRQLYVDDARTLGRKYDLVNAYGLRGAGIWALGYDGTRTELWNAIQAKFITDNVPPAISGATLSSQAFSPNGDGALDSITARLTVSGLIRWGYRVQGVDGVTLGPNLRSGTVSGRTPAYTWDGRDAGGTRVADGPYRVTLWAEDTSANRSERGLAVMVDTRPAILTTAVGTGFVTPDGDRKSDTLALRWSSDQRLTGSARIRDRAGVTVRSWSFSGKTSGGATWDGRDARGAVLSDAPYTFRVDGRDKGGNRTVVDRPVIVDRTIRSVSWSDGSFDPRAGERSRASIVLRRAAVITVAIYRGNTLIKRVWTDAWAPAGTFTHTWDGRTSTGALATPGSYRIRVTARSWIGPTWYSRDVVVETH
jgi:spore germination protein YaaH/flagellar hook assembly protein FlgD